MKKIVCEICESTDFIKENGLFVCQGCGCRYSTEEIKKIVKEVRGEEYQQNTNNANETSADCRENIPIHTLGSPNKLFVNVVKVGHETYTMASVSSLSVLMGAEPAPVFVDGPDEVGNIGAEICLENIAGKTIKYATVYLVPFNAVGDQVSCTVQGHTSYGVMITGPIAAGQKREGYSEGMWYNNSIVHAKIDYVHVIYMDGTEEIYEGKEFYNNPSKKADTTQKGTIIFHGFTMPLPLVSEVSIRINGEEIGSVKRKKRLSWEFEGTAQIDLKYKGDFKWRENVMSLTAPTITNVQLEYGTNNLVASVW